MPEVVFTVVILGLVAVVALTKTPSPGSLTLHAQAQSAADLARRAQSLAMVRGQRMSVNANGGTGTFSIACTTGTIPCSTDSSFSVSQGVAVGGASTVYFNTLGQPVNSAGAPLTSDASYTLSDTSSGTTFTIAVAVLTGRVSVSP